MRKIATCFLAAAVLFSSCSVNHYMYAPAAVQSPMLNSKGEMSATGMFTSGLYTKDSGYNNGYDLQGAYAVSNHVALTAAFSKRMEKDTYTYEGPGWFYIGPAYSAQLHYKRSLTELGMGYFTSIDSDNEVFFDLYGGYGFGKYSMRELGYITRSLKELNHTTSVRKFYLQPGFHFNASDMSQVSLSFGINAIHYYDIKSDYTRGQEDSLHISPVRTTTFAYLSPAFAVRLWIPHTPWIKLVTQLSGDIKLTRQTLYHRKFNLSMGLSFDLSKLGQHSNYKPKKKGRRLPDR